MEQPQTGASPGEASRAEQNRELVEIASKNDIKREIENYGLINLYPQDDQISDTMIDGEIDEQKSLMIVMPIIFLSVAILVMGIMVKRIIEQQRMQIGILKSFGYSDFQVGFHYASYCLIIGLIDSIIGCEIGRAHV